jgi:hypothetical protein
VRGAGREKAQKAQNKKLSPASAWEAVSSGRGRKSKRKINTPFSLYGFLRVFAAIDLQRQEHF